MKRMLIAILSLAPIADSGADIYKYVAPDGRVYYTDEPKKGLDYRLIIRTRPRTYQRDLKFMSGNRLKFNDLIAKAAAKHQMDPKLLHAVIQAESAYNPNAVSSAGAVGLMQLMPDTARRYGVTDRRDAEQNVDGGTRYLKDLLAMFNSNLTLAVAGYNAGEGAVMKYGNSVPPYPETRNYVQHVLSLYRKS
ncbi:MULTISPECIES: lytic transglycosylase domain-containing protein [Methylomonas]|uniref:Lytic transglycosylase n=1 Tax=Methylomonas koyamae TaxID=702114 RepID=A0A177P248_9GAMM|nr:MULTISPECIES: transglycosylase SLT domain-containing protein [Methylomonas]ANE54892.1 lytic transglycosylase [Methylomonas sp. DH-1]ATG89605.1 lytic transglycosylase [Methylomonas koyamae]OAI19278.1 lytic transglycosylase [Methylomonas koyamae]OAI23479.1 lytic transglycosylase [Methylomonas koyamae]WNB74710.1 transglycosylase SLT domain-containing protein [Methylomonas koyamae]